MKVLWFTGPVGKLGIDLPSSLDRLSVAETITARYDNGQLCTFRRKPNPTKAREK